MSLWLRELAPWLRDHATNVLRGHLCRGSRSYKCYSHQLNIAEREDAQVRAHVGARRRGAESSPIEVNPLALQHLNMDILCRKLWLIWEIMCSFTWHMYFMMLIVPWHQINWHLPLLLRVRPDRMPYGLNFISKLDQFVDKTCGSCRCLLFLFQHQCNKVF